MLTLARTDNSSCPRIDFGHQFAIVLERPSGTGYRWTIQFDEDQLSLVADSETTASPAQPGSPVTHEWILTAKARGVAQIRCMLSRSWEHAPVDTVEFHVDCQ
jgi:predicted secreted protein